MSTYRDGLYVIWPNPQKWIVCDFPQVVIKVSKVATVAAPENLLRFLDGLCTCIDSGLKHFIHFCFRVNIVCQGESAEAASRRRDFGVFC